LHPRQASGTTDANGAAQVDIQHNLLNLFWRIHQVAVNVEDGIIAVQLLVNGISHTSKVVIRTPAVATQPPSIDIAGHDVLSVVITEAPVDALVTVAYYYDEMPGRP
jgi:hypothetical protein